MANWWDTLKFGPGGLTYEAMTKDKPAKEDKKAPKSDIKHIMATLGLTDEDIKRLETASGMSRDQLGRVTPKVIASLMEALSYGIDLKGRWGEELRGKRDELAAQQKQEVDALAPPAGMTDEELNELRRPYMSLGLTAEEADLLSEWIMMGSSPSEAYQAIQQIKGAPSQTDLQQAQLATEPRYWIPQWMQSHEGELPPQPPWMTQFSGGQTGQQIDPTQKPKMPSAQSWGKMQPSEQEAYQGWVGWLGYSPEDYMRKAQKLAPPGGEKKLKWGY